MQDISLKGHGAIIALKEFLADLAANRASGHFSVVISYGEVCGLSVMGCS